MSGKDEGVGLFRRMARKVAAPARELVGIQPREDSEGGRATEFDKAEMKAMIERKRRNDYVRKRELDTLRRIRREGLSGEQAQALTMQSSRMDDTETRSTPSSPQTSGIKAKIDAIERQMVGASAGVSAGSGTTRPSRLGPPTMPPGPPPPILTTTLFDEEDPSLLSHDAPTVPVPLAPPPAQEGVAVRPELPPLSLDMPEPDPASPPDAGASTMPASSFENTRPFVPTLVPPPPVPPAPAPAPVLAPVQPAPPRAPVGATVALGGGESVEVAHVVHDEALDEAVIAFAGGDFQACEGSLQALVGPRGDRRDHDETWLVLFDLYRAIGQQAKFEALTMDYVERFHRSAPQWFSLPKMLAGATATPAGRQPASQPAGGVGWVCPESLDAEAVNRLDALSMQLPLPWVLDWSALKTLDVEGAGRLRKLFAGWAGQAVTMHWIAAERLNAVLQEIAPAGARDADPVYWMLRLEALRLLHRPDQFDEVAIDYCVTFEVSPPSWENARCKALPQGGTHQNTRTLSLSVVGEAVTSFSDTSMLADDEHRGAAPVQITSVELSGQLSGDLGPLLDKLSKEIGASRVVRISCSLLMRVDFVAAGDLLNWVASRHAEGREILFLETHRLVALMFGAMGINETARIQLRQA